jgi:nucleoside-diphosphate-sugar epimerase
MTLDPNPNKVIPEVLAGMNGILKSAAKEPSVKRFVATSSYAAATLPSPGKVFHIDSNTWNDAAIKDAWAPPPYQPERRIAVYAASKVESERSLWKFVKDQNPHFVVNTVLPDNNIGLILDKNLHLIASSAGSVTELFNGKEQHLPPRESLHNAGHL